MYTVLCVDDNQEELEDLRFQLSPPFAVHLCDDGRKARALVAELKPHVVLLDLDMPGYSGFRVLDDIRTLSSPPPVLMLSGHIDPMYVVRAIHAGADYYVAKPYHPRKLCRRLERLISERESLQALSGSAAGSGIASLIGSSSAMCAMRKLILAYAHVELPVLILGESGTGKDLAARALHECSERSQGPYIVRNIAAIPEGLVESTLFGCEPGAFTGARQMRGCFEEAHGGTLFLDEIGDAKAAAQVALLRIIEEGLVQRLGSGISRRVDCRIVAATNQDLPRLIELKQFREDLYFRLEPLTLHMPSLRSRPEDIPELVSHYARTMAPGLELAPDVMHELCIRAWPGNVRQLFSCLGRAWVLAERRTVQLEHISLAGVASGDASHRLQPGLPGLLAPGR